MKKQLIWNELLKKNLEWAMNKFNKKIDKLKNLKERITYLNNNHWKYPKTTMKSKNNMEE